VSGRARVRLFWLFLLYPAWLLLQAFHEVGHVLHAVLSGGQQIDVDLPLFGFSRTDVAINPRPLFVAAGGVIWGSLLPVLLLAILRRRWAVAGSTAAAFAGLCLIGNGVYLAVGWIDRVGDAGDLMKHGVPTAVLIAVGGGMTAAGLWLWHRLGESTSGKDRGGRR